MFSTARNGAVAALLALTLAAPALAEEATVSVTQVTFDRTTELESAPVASVRLSGTIACAADGPAALTTTRAVQGNTSGQDNWDLYMFDCSTEGRPFSVIVESLTCDPDFAADQCFRHGPMQVEMADADGNRIASARIVVHKPNDARHGGRGRSGSNGNSSQASGRAAGGQGSSAQAPAATEALQLGLAGSRQRWPPYLLRV